MLTPFSLTLGFCLVALTLASRSSSDTYGSSGDNGGGPPAAKQHCQVTSPFDKSQFVSLHNVGRSACQADDVVWDEDLAATAQCWANRCNFEHSHTDGLGENIAAGSGGKYDTSTAFSDWFEEFRQWNNGMDFSEQTGHFTQVAWKDTKRIGCAVASCSAGQLGLGGSETQAKFVVCEYWPPGNVIGRFSGQVQLPSGDPLKNGNSDKYASGGNSNGDNDNGSSNSSSSGNGNNNNNNNNTPKKPSKHPHHHKGNRHPQKHPHNQQQSQSDSDTYAMQWWQTFQKKSTKTPAGYRRSAMRSHRRHINIRSAADQSAIAEQV